VDRSDCFFWFFGFGFGQLQQNNLQQQQRSYTRNPSILSTNPNLQTLITSDSFFLRYLLFQF